MDFHIENWDEISPIYFMTRYGNHSNSSMLQAKADRPKLPVRASDAKTPQDSTSEILRLAMNKSYKNTDECFSSAFINFTAAMRISNCRGLLVSLLRICLSLVSECTDKHVHFRLNF